MTKVQYWVVTTIAAACFSAMATNIAVGYTNGTTRNDVNLRQQFVQQSIQLEGLYKELIRNLAELGARNNDSDIKAMLQKHGITYNFNAPQSVQATATTPVRK